jgi:hypothetical protein
MVPYFFLVPLYSGGRNAKDLAGYLVVVVLPLAHPLDQLVDLAHEEQLLV